MTIPIEALEAIARRLGSVVCAEGWKILGRPRPWLDAVKVGEMKSSGDVVYHDPWPSTDPSPIVWNTKIGSDLSTYIPGPKWRTRAACAGHEELEPDAWVPQQGNTGAAARRVCITECPVAVQCLTDAVVRNDTHGIRGGLGSGKRRRLRRNFVLFPHQFARLAQQTIDQLAAGETPVWVKNTNTDGATCGHLSSWNRGCRCRGCRTAASKASLSRRVIGAQDEPVTIELPNVTFEAPPLSEALEAVR